ncbi:MAG: SulP family inorganic anion transporter [Rhodobacteraceae bacterium]|nr:MAG: SulP family inorganic anion transporter [Paracoccaceae bacterium]
MIGHGFLREAATSAAASPRFIDLFTPKLVTVFREGYGLSDLRADFLAGLTVAIVALPLSMAIAIASGVSPEHGLYSAIVGGFLVSALGGSRHQIGGPAGAFIVLVSATVARHGLDGLLLATLLAGLMLTAAGFLRLGTYIKFIPYPVTVGFTAGIAVIIFASQIAPLFGLTLDGAEPSAVLEKLPALWAARETVNPVAFGVAAAVIAVIALTRRFAPAVPGMLVAIAAAGLAAWGFDLPVETVADRFGALPSGPPAFVVPEIGWEKVAAVLPDAFAFALLGAIESLLSAVVADGMTGRQHRSNCELVAQGAANVGAALFGGFVVTGTIARTATNVRAGARGPVSGMLHALILLGFLVVAAPLAGAIPLAALAGVLATVAWTMAEKHAFATLATGDRGDAVALFATFLLTVFRDLTEAIIAGFAIGSVVFIHRMSTAATIRAEPAFTAEDRPDVMNRREPEAAPDIVVHRITGVLFFGAASIVEGALDKIGADHRAMVIDIAAVPFLDSSGAHSLEGLVRRAERRGIRVYVVGADARAKAALRAEGLAAPRVHYLATVDAALSAWRRRSAEA